MTRDENRHDEALARVLGEVCQERPPELDWQRVEDDAIRRFRRGGPAPQGGAAWRTWAAVAAGALAIGTLVLTARLADEAGVANAPATTMSTADHASVDVTELNGASLSPGDVVTAAHTITRVTHDTHSTWELALGSSAKLAGQGSIVEVELLRGTLSASVEPTAASRSFVVRASGAVVSVRGTEFRLVLEGGKLLVDVTEGVVGVRGAGEKRETVLRAPATRTFPAHVNPEAPATAPPPRPRVPSDGQPGKAIDRSPQQGQASAGGTDPAMARVVAGLRRCFDGQLGANGGTRVAVRTHLAVEVDGSGRITDSHFEPPLAPSIIPCARAAVDLGRFPASTAPYRVERELTFGADAD